MPRLNLRRRAGYTLIEALVVMTLLGIIGGSLVSLLTRQQRFYRDAGETVAVRRELRTGASLLPMEARSLSTVGGDVLAMSNGSFTFRATIGSGVACAVGSAALTLPPTNLAKHTLTAWYTPPAAGDTVFVFDEDTLAGAEDDKWRKYGVQSVTTSTSACPGAPYTDAALDLPSTKPRWVLAVDGGPLPASIKPGAVVRITRPVRYSLFAAGSGRWYLGYEEHRGGAWSTVEPVGGPYLPSNGSGAGGGLRFAYFDTLGTTTTMRDRLARVDVVLRAESGPSSMPGREGEPLRDSLLFRIGIRNVK